MVLFTYFDSHRAFILNDYLSYVSIHTKYNYRTSFQTGNIYKFDIYLRL